MDQHPLANRGPTTETLPLQSRLAQDGIRFSNAFTVLPICSPARASMLTGLYPHVHGLTENDGRFGGRAELTPQDWMVHRPFAQAGYRTAWFGKWHLDNISDAGLFGFEGWSLPGYGYPYASSAYADYLERHSLPDPVVQVEVPGESQTRAGTRISLTELDDWPDYEAGTMRLEGPATCHEAYFVADLARNWITENATEPFFVRIDPWGPHPPYIVSGKFDGLFGTDPDFRTPNFQADLAARPTHHRTYRDTWAKHGWTDADWRLLARRSVEQAALVETALCGVIETLQATDLADRTIIILCADHGDAIASNGRVANKGGLLVEETVRIPLLVSGPQVPRGRTSHAVVTNLDIAPFILAAADLPGANHLPGRNLMDAADPEKDPKRDGVLLQHYGLYQPILQRAWRTNAWKLIVQEDGFSELYDMAEDPHEMCNLANDPAYASTFQALRTALIDEMTRLDDTGNRQSNLMQTLLAQ